jgi:hypothetical protein
MMERPILFTGVMVRAILEGRKTQTRRVMKCQPRGDYTEVRAEYVDAGPVVATYRAYPQGGSARWGICSCPFGREGDRIWVRETWAPLVDVERVGPPDDRYFYKGPEVEKLGCDYVLYRADGETEFCDEDGGMTERSFWKPSIFMPKWASRLTLEITGIRVEQVQDINANDSIAEGCVDAGYIAAWDSIIADGSPIDDTIDITNTIVGEYTKLWDSINVARGFGWQTNPWVWVITFKRIES